MWTHSSEPPSSQCRKRIIMYTLKESWEEWIWLYMEKHHLYTILHPFFFFSCFSGKPSRARHLEKTSLPASSPLLASCKGPGLALLRGKESSEVWLPSRIIYPWRNIKPTSHTPVQSVGSLKVELTTVRSDWYRNRKDNGDTGYFPGNTEGPLAISAVWTQKVAQAEQTPPSPGKISP